MLSENIPEDDPEAVVLDTIERHGRALRDLEKDILVLVTEAYFRGSSWVEIARRLDRSKQTVHQRYQPRVHTGRTQNILLADVAEAEQRARQICHHNSDGTAVERAKAFLRERATLVS